MTRPMPHIPTLQQAKSVVLAYYKALDTAQTEAEICAVLDTFIADDYIWRGMHPFNIHCDKQTVAREFWTPLKQSLHPLQRRPDIFFAGQNTIDNKGSIWVVQMGHFMGLFDTQWLGIPPTGKMTFMRYVEFHCVQDGKITATTLHFDIPMVMVQAGVNPFPPSTGAFCIQPGPLPHDGLLFDAGDPILTQHTLDTMERMEQYVIQGRTDTSLDGLGDAWHEDMIWFGPCGIGATYTKQRYQKQHRCPLVKQMNFNTSNKNLGHIASLAEGNYGGFFGWPNFYAMPTGGFMGMPSNDSETEWRVVDIYRVTDKKIAENWIFIDLLHLYKGQGVDILDRIQQTTQAQHYTGWGI